MGDGKLYCHAQLKGDEINEFDRYYQHDGFRCETIVGIVKAKDMQEAEKIVKNHYEKAYRGEFQRDGWKLEEVEFSDDGCSEIYYG